MKIDGVEGMWLVDMLPATEYVTCHAWEVHAYTSFPTHIICAKGVREPASGALGPYAQLKGARVFSAMTRLQSQRLIQVILFR